MKISHFILLVVSYLTFISCEKNENLISFPEAGYEIEVPDWWNKNRKLESKEISSSLPILDSIKDNISIRTFEKSEFEDYKDFENWVIKKYTIGQPPDWSISHRILSVDQSKVFESFRNSYKTKLLRNGKEILCCYILLETSKSYVWINYQSTDITYERNFNQFSDVMSNFRIIE